MEKVLVTGATGYIALHCVQQLLDQGYAVNGSIRSPERKKEVIEALKNSGTSTENLNLFVFDTKTIHYQPVLSIIFLLNILFFVLILYKKISSSHPPFTHNFTFKLF